MMVSAVVNIPGFWPKLLYLSIENRPTGPIRSSSRDVCVSVCLCVCVFDVPFHVIYFEAYFAPTS